ncbi:hypothetical protein COY05_04140 [Candidatus Peregrinibacteria bacterium CG_4_10_14_0_2_um_filter_38_24]|nr:MAG: hypothetical protein COY05_04140 [Candidatus Peregrinibacteria bacterium CG_4_10_14_0_2_um_filter_38_24]
MAGLNSFTGSDGAEFDVRSNEVFVWERDASKRMIENAGKPVRARVAGVSMPSVRSKYFVEIPDSSVGGSVPKKVCSVFPDLRDAPELDMLTGKGALESGFSDPDVIADYVGLRVDAVGVVVIGSRGGFNKPECEEFISEAEVAEQERRAFDLQLARAQKAEKREGLKEGENGEKVVEMDVGVFNLQLARARKAVGLGRDGRLLKRKGAKKSADTGSAASV